MPPFGPISQMGLVRALRKLGFEEPVPGTRHAFMTKGSLRLRIPHPHHGDVGRDLLARILREAGISREDWEAV
ncbi:MAG: type II toxin-antitoxin system HicA family toxin [Dehalococcoidia bacterium]|nr:type II toxin-antitoxin system HicA family toxin [Dehalococcoidia bacterium]